MVGLTISVLALATWMAFRTTAPWGVGLHSFRPPYRFPVTVLDYVPFLLAFLVLSTRPLTVKLAGQVCWALAATIPVQLALAVGERFLGWEGPLFLGVGGFDVVQVVFRTTINDRTTAGFYNPNILGCYGVVASLACLGLLLQEAAAARSRDQPQLAARLRIAYLTGSIVGCAAMLVWSRSRNAWLVLLILGVAYLLYERIRPRYLLPLPALLVLLVGFASINVGEHRSSLVPQKVSELSRQLVPEIIWKRLTREPLPMSRSQSLGGAVEWRRKVFLCSIETALEKPWAGWGIGGSAPECERRLGFRINHAHNIFLQLWVDVGTPFSVLALLLMGYVVVTTSRAMLARASRHRFRGPPAALCFMALSIVLLSQLSLAVMLSWGLMTLFWVSVAIPFSIAQNSNGVRYQSQG